MELGSGTVNTTRGWEKLRLLKMPVNEELAREQPSCQENPKPQRNVTRKGVGESGRVERVEVAVAPHERMHTVGVKGRKPWRHEARARHGLIGLRARPIISRTVPIEIALGDVNQHSATLVYESA